MPIPTSVPMQDINDPPTESYYLLACILYFFTAFLTLLHSHLHEFHLLEALHLKKVKVDKDKVDDNDRKCDNDRK